MKCKKILSCLLISFLIVSSCVICSKPVSAYSEAPLIESGKLYYIKNKNSGKYLDVDHSAASLGTNVLQWPLNKGVGQKWKVVHTGNGLYKFISQVGDKNTVLDVSQKNNENRTNIDIWLDMEGATDRRFRIIRNNDGYSYRIVSQCSNFTKAVTVEGASCESGANVFQYQYNSSNNDEWIFEPVDEFSMDLATNYARKNAFNAVPTYPNLKSWDADCANFASQILLAGGIHFEDSWYVYKKNNNYISPERNNISQLNESWSLASPSPWISAPQFNTFWSGKVRTETYLGSYITQNPTRIYNLNFYRGDAVQLLNKDFWGRPSDAYHTMVITGYGKYNNQNSYTLTYHTVDRLDKSLLQIAEENPDDYFRFFIFV